MFKSKILGTGSYLPEKILTNKDLEKLVETSDEWIVERTGIRERHITPTGVNNSDLATRAATRALEMAKLTSKDLDAILVATVTGDHIMPSTACLVQKKLGARDIFALDISAACSGFLYGLSIAHQFIQTGVYKNILILGSEVLSRIMNYKDRNTCILFGDGAGAVILGRSEDNEKSNVLSSHLHADGSLGSLLELPAGGTAIRITPDILEKNLQYVHMQGKEIFKNAVRTMAECAREALNHNKIDQSSLDWFIPHQANVRITDSVAKYFNIPKEKVIINLDRTGNTSSATIPIALDEAIRDQRIQRGHLILMTTFGAGLTSGSVLLKY